MDAKGFMKGVVAYYGDYDNQVVATAVLNHVSHLDEKDKVDLAALLDGVFLLHSRRYKVTPDVAMIEEARKLNAERVMPWTVDRQGVCWKYGRRAGHYDGAQFISEPWYKSHRAQITAKERKELPDVERS